MENEEINEEVSKKDKKAEHLKWDNMDGFEKTFWLLSLITSIAFIATVIFIKNWSFNIITSSLLYASVLFNGISIIKRNKKSAIFVIIIALICAAVTAILYFTKVLN